MFVFIVRFRRGRPWPNRRRAPQIRGNTNLEIAWTIVPVLIVAVIVGYVFVDSCPTSRTSRAASAGNTIDIRVEGHQYYWLFEYPGGQVSIDEMVVPGRAVWSH